MVETKIKQKNIIASTKTVRRKRKGTSSLNRTTPFDVFLNIFMGILGLIMAFPFYYMLIVSVGTYEDIQNSTPYLWPSEIDFSSYKLVFNSQDFLSSIGVSTFITIAGTLLGIIVSVAGAYVLSKKHILGGKAMFRYVLITMLFSGGTIPLYLVIQKVGLGNKLWVMVLPTLTAGYYIILLKNSFEQIPPSIEESARIDGANDLEILFKIVLPMSMPIIATISLFLAVGKWNEYFIAMLNIIDRHKKPLQLVLREVLLDSAQHLSGVAASIASAEQQIYTPSLQMATVTIATIPIVIVYPFLQKHFASGVMAGGVKG